MRMAARLLKSRKELTRKKNTSVQRDMCSNRNTNSTLVNAMVSRALALKKRAASRWKRMAR